MLTRLRFKNWRSLKDVEIDDLTPITVFIGANSSGKTNIVDGLRFYRDSLTRGLLQVVFESGYIKIQTDAFHNNEDVEIDLVFDLEISPHPITRGLILKFDKRDVPFDFRSTLSEGNEVLEETEFEELPIRDEVRVFSYSLSEDQRRKADRAREIKRYINLFVQKRWQILGDNIVPPLRLSQREGGDIYLAEPDARNTLRILAFMRSAHQELYNQLQEDLIWMLGHVTALDIVQWSEERELELLVREKDGKGAPTVSSGTARLIAMLTAIYALDMPQGVGANRTSEAQDVKASMPGLVVIEEPDTALNPGIHRNFVEQLRNYTSREGYPRQFILTTHNPHFLNYFKPEEVRVVERDEQGYTHVHKIPEFIDDIWLDEYGLGEVWTTNSFGGLPK